MNTYFRAVLAEQVQRADFEPKEYARLANCQTPAAPALLQDTSSKDHVSFDSIPATILEHVLQHCNLLTACNAAKACRSLHQVGALPCLLRELLPCTTMGNGNRLEQSYISSWL